MKITKVCCQGCGADLQVDETVRYVTCNYCHARLEVVHDPSVTHTRLMEKLEKNTERMAENLRVIELQNELARMDREWEQERETFMVEGKHGKRSLPSKDASAMSLVVGVIAGLILLGISLSSGNSSVFGFVGLLVAVLSIVQTIKGLSQASEYDRALSMFEERRADLIRQIGQARQL